MLQNYFNNLKFKKSNKKNNSDITMKIEKKIYNP
jgi:hypothetical protein